MGQQKQGNKAHKTLREKLRKKRQQQKAQKKAKREKHKQYNSQEEKRKFFQGKHQQSKHKIKQHKLKKHIEKFIDIYEDSMEDFYQIFETLDEGHVIDIADLENLSVQKCLKKMFKYLPLEKKKLEYQRKRSCKVKMEVLMRELLTKAMQDYLQYGTQSEQESSNQQQAGVQKSKHVPIVAEKNQQEQECQNLALYKHALIPEPEVLEPSVGPFIPAEEREKLAAMFDNNEGKQEKAVIDDEEDHFNKLFNIESKPKQKQGGLNQIPSELLAEGSAQIGEKQEIDHNEIQQYNAIHRPKKLIEEHQQILGIGEYAKQKDKQKRKPFDRQRDIVNGRMGNMMRNGVFFDFKDRMTKPKTSNSFL